MMNVKHLLIDVDGPIISSERMSKRIERDYNIPTEKLLPFMDHGKFQDCLVGKADLKEGLSGHLEEWGWKKSLDDFLEYWFANERDVNHDLVEYIQSIRKKGIWVHAHTNQEKYRTQYMLEEIGLKSVFDQFFSSAYLRVKKPEHAYFQKIFDKFKFGDENISKEQIVFWDDDQKNVEAGNDFGFPSFLYKNINTFKKKMINILNI